MYVRIKHTVCPTCPCPQRTPGRCKGAVSFSNPRTRRSGALPPSPPTDRADDATVSSSDLSEDAATTVSGETAPSDASSALTSLYPDSDQTKGTREIQGPKNIQEVGIEETPRGERILHDVAHTVGGEGPSSMPRGYPPKLDLGAAHPLSKSHSSDVYCCITEDSHKNTPHSVPDNNEAALSVKIGWCDEIPRWLLEQCLTYVVCKETFPTRSDGIHAAKQFAKAILMWGDVGVTFKEVPRKAAANLRVVYSPQDHALALAFFPNDNPPEDRTLWIYAPAFEPQHRNNQANFLAHEIGHILGLRHECAMRTEQWMEAVMWGKESPKSVMRKSHPNSNMWRVQQQDLDEVKSFYKTSQTTHDRKMIRDYTAPSAVYPGA